MTDNQESLQFCLHCRKPKRAIRPGSLTSWVFKAATCTCNLKTDESKEQEPLAIESSESLALLKLSSRFEILSELGHGGMGTVYVGRDHATEELVAIKVLRDDLANNESAVRRFREEVLAAQYLNHPNMVSIKGFGTTDDGAPYLVMEFVDGANLAELLKQEYRLNPDVVVDIFIQLADALSDAHQKDIVHRDIKPENILVRPINDKEFQVKVVDFGIAKVLYETTDESEMPTHSTDIVGSPLYMSPEQCTGRTVDKRTDVYSIGCVMYETLTGTSPFYSTNPVKTILMHLNDPPPKLKVTAPAIEHPADLELIVFKCLKKDPRLRYQSVTALRDDLIAFKRRSVTNALKEDIAVHALTVAVLGTILGVIAYLIMNPAIVWKLYQPDNVIEITDRYTGKAIYTTVSARSTREAVKEAVDRKVNLAGADLRGKNLSGMLLNNAQLRESDLSEASLHLTNLSNADLSHAKANRIVAQRVNISHANLAGADLSGAQLNSAWAETTNFTDADLSFSSMASAVVKNARFDHADLYRCDISGVLPRDTEFNNSYGVKKPAPSE